MCFTLKGCTATAYIGGLNFYSVKTGTVSGATVTINRTTISKDAANIASNTVIAEVALKSGYENLSVTVTMGGSSVNNWYANGTVTIPAGTTVNGDIKISASATAINTGGGVVEPEQPGTGGSGETDSIVFNFDQTNENGVDLPQVGTISGGKLTISTTKTINYSGITLSSTEDWTFECIALPSTTTGLIPLGSESTKGGFIQLPNPKGADTACMRLRDLDRTMSAEASWTTGYTEPTHFAITYSSSSKVLKMYMNYSELTVNYSTGSIDTFNTFTPGKLFGGYNNGSYDFCGDLYYMSFTNSVLTSDQFHRE